MPTYDPGVPPDGTLEDFKAWTAYQFRLISAAIIDPSAKVITLPPSAAAPTRIFEGMVINADGTNFNPGGGAGLYQRLSGAWVKL